MAASTSLLQFLLMLAAGWLQRQQAATIEYLKAENRLLRERLGGRRIVFTDAERRRLTQGTWFARTATHLAKAASLVVAALAGRRDDERPGDHQSTAQRDLPGQLFSKHGHAEQDGECDTQLVDGRHQ